MSIKSEPMDFELGELKHFEATPLQLVVNSTVTDDRAVMQTTRDSVFSNPGFTGINRHQSTTNEFLRTDRLASEHVVAVTKHNDFTNSHSSRVYSSSKNRHPNFTIARGEIELNSKFLPKKYRCGFCIYKTSYKSDLNRHLRRHSQDASFHCEECNMPFKTEGLVYHHRRTVHGEGRTSAETTYQCNICPYGTPFEIRYSRHMQQHSTCKYVCGVCNMPFFTDDTLKQHKESVHGMLNSSGRLDSHSRDIGKIENTRCSFQVSPVSSQHSFQPPSFETFVDNYNQGASSYCSTPDLNNDTGSVGHEVIDDYFKPALSLPHISPNAVGTESIGKNCFGDVSQSSHLDGLQIVSVSPESTYTNSNRFEISLGQSDLIRQSTKSKLILGDSTSPTAYNNTSPTAYNNNSPTSYSNKSPTVYSNSPTAYNNSHSSYSNKSPTVYSNSPTAYNNNSHSSYSNKSPTVYSNKRSDTISNLEMESNSLNTSVKSISDDQNESVTDASAAHNKHYCCERCGLTFKSLDGILNHKPSCSAVNHSPVKTCSLCPFQTINQDVFERHFEKHSMAPYCCELCNRPFVAIANLINHKREVHRNTSERNTVISRSSKNCRLPRIRSNIWSSRVPFYSTSLRTTNTIRPRNQGMHLPNKPYVLRQSADFLNNKVAGLPKLSPNIVKQDRKETEKLISTQPPESRRYAKLVSDFDEFASRPYACALCFYKTNNITELSSHVQNHLTGCNFTPIPETARFISRHNFKNQPRNSEIKIRQHRREETKSFCPTIVNPIENNIIGLPASNDRIQSSVNDAQSQEGIETNDDKSCAKEIKLGSKLSRRQHQKSAGCFVKRRKRWNYKVFEYKSNIPGRRRFSCSTCDKSFSMRALLARHVDKMHR